MADENVRGAEEINFLMRKQSEIQDKVMDAINNKQKEVSVDIGKTVVIIRLLEAEDGNYSMTSSEDNVISGTVTVDKETKKVKSYRDVDVDLDRKRIGQMLDEKRRYELDIQEDIKDRTVDKNDSHALQLEVEAGLRNGNATEMEAGRKFSDENMHQFISRAWKVSCNKVYRVKGKGTHDFKYVVKDNSGKYQELDLSTNREGTNTRQSIWIMENGDLKEKKVDSLLIRGRYGIATDLPENVASQNTRSYLVTRAPSGRYIAIAAGQKRGVNRNTSGDKLQKKDGAAGRSVYELEDIIDAAEIAEKIYAFNKDGKLTTKEVEMVKKFKIDKNMGDKDIFEAVTLIVELKDMGYKCEEMKTILSARSKEEIKDLAKKVDEHYKDNKDGTKDKTKKIDEDIKEKSIHDGDDHSHGRGIPGPRH